MNPQKKILKQISTTIDKLHLRMVDLKERVQLLEDENALQLMNQLEIVYFTSLRQLRMYLEIPYDGHEDMECKKY